MNQKIVLMVFVGFFLLPINHIFADEESAEISIEFLNGDVMDLDAGTQMIRADIAISHYNPQDGYYFMEVKRMSDETIIKNSEILPSYIDDDLYGVQILHYLDPSTTEEIVGDYELRIYSEFGDAESTVPFSIIKSSQTPIIAHNSDILEVTHEEDSAEELEFEETTETESKIPEWIHDIFKWFAEGEIGEDDLLSAIKYLVESDIIILDK